MALLKIMQALFLIALLSGLLYFLSILFEFDALRVRAPGSCAYYCELSKKQCQG